MSMKPSMLYYNTMCADSINWPLWSKWLAYCANVILGTFRSLRFTVGWPLKSYTHTGIFPSVSGSSAIKRKLRKVLNHRDVDVVSSPSIGGWIRFGLDTQYEREYSNTMVECKNV